jgi:CRP-like cAMP-binding protein
VLNITEHNLKTYHAVKLMVEGEHIGEIGLVFKCKRTASVVSRNYNTLGRLTRDNFRMVCSDYPEFFTTMKKYTQGYKYKKKKFILNCLKKVEFLQNLTVEE